MSDTPKHFRRPRPSPQPWKLEVPKYLDLEEEFSPSEDDTCEFLINDPDDYMDAQTFEDEDTQVWKRVSDDLLRTR